jgi:two-component system chemotaxis response regulator CheY
MGYKVLIVEDSTASREFIASTIQQIDGAEVVCAGSGFDALKLLPRFRFDLIITDINMPDINGLELIQFIRSNEHHRATPILLISTQASDRDRERGLALGANAYVSKPFTPEDLRSKVKAELEKGRPRTGGDG